MDKFKVEMVLKVNPGESILMSNVTEVSFLQDLNLLVVISDEGNYTSTTYFPLSEVLCYSEVKPNE